MTQQEYENEIKEVQDVIKKAQDKLEQLKAAKIADSGKRWKPKRNGVYFMVLAMGDVMHTIWTGDIGDDWCYLTGNCFKTEGEAEEHKKQIEYTARYKNYIEEHSDPIDWDNENQLKYCGGFWFSGREIEVLNSTKRKPQGAIYASSEQIIWDAIKEIGEDNFKKYVLGVK